MSSTTETSLLDATGRLVVWNQHGPEAGRRISSAFPQVDVVDIPWYPHERPEPSADVLFAAGRYDAPTAGWARDVRWVHAGSSGIDSYPADLLAAPVVTCSRGIRAATIADFVLAAILSEVKEIPRIWSPGATAGDFDLGTLQGATVGIVGFGSIGQQVARRALAFDARVLASRRNLDTELPAALRDVVLVPTEQVVAEAEHLVLAVPATAETTGLFGDDLLSRVRPGSHLINVARGALVDDCALLRALDSGLLSRATLDVTEPEPLPDDHPLRAHPRVRLSPHVSYQDRRPQEVVARFIENLGRYLDGRPLLGVVDTTAGY